MRAADLLTFSAVRVGDSLPPLRKTISVEQIRQYAEASGDHNPIHLDDAFARAAGLPGVIAHGMLTMSCVDQMVTDWLGDRSRLRALSGRFAAMVVPGDEVTCSGTVAAKDDAARLVSIHVSAHNQRGEKVFTKGIAEAEFEPI
jgi:acyl dehydratase